MNKPFFLSMVIATFVAPLMVRAEERPLASLVPDDVGMCIQVDDLTRRATQFTDSRLYARLQKFPPIADWMAANSQPLEQLGERIARRLDMEPDELWKNVFGNEALFGVWPGTSTDDSGALLLVRASEANVLRRMLDGLDAVQKRADMITESKDLEHAGLAYRMRRLSQGKEKQVLYLATIDTLGVMTSRETIMRRVLELSAAEINGGGSLADLPAFRKGIARLHSNTVVSMFTNPRQWDDLMQAQLHDTDDDELGEEFVKRGLIEAWKVSDYWVAGVKLGQPLLIEAYVHFDRAAMAQPYRQALASLEGKATFLARIPDDAMVAYAGSIDLGALSNMFLSGGGDRGNAQIEGVREIARGLMGMDLFEDVLSNLGSDAGAYVIAHRPKGEDEVPLDLVFGVQVKRDEVATALNRSLSASMRLIAEIQNGDNNGAAVVKSEKVSGGELTSIKGLNLLPAGVEATYAIVDGYLYAGTSHDEVLRAVTLNSDASLATSPYVRPLLDDRIAEPGHVLYVNCKALRELLAAHPDQLAGYLARVRGLDAETSKRIVVQLGIFAELADALMIVGRVDEQGLAITFRISASENIQADASRLDKPTTSREVQLAPVR